MPVPQIALSLDREYRGIALLVYFRMRAPERIDQTAQLYISGDETTDASYTDGRSPWRFLSGAVTGSTVCVA
jgi:hypothetical protein